MTDIEQLKTLRLQAEVARELSVRDLKGAKSYIDDIIIPELRKTVSTLCLPIKERHQVNLTESGRRVHCVHYTNIDTLINLLSSSANKEINYLRLYDSWHFNDPSEGSYFARQAKIPELDHLFSVDQIQHAYVASFILDEHDNKSDDLLLWLMYGKNGEGCSLRWPLPANRLLRVLYGSDEAKAAGQKFNQIYNDYKLVLIELLDQVITVFTRIFDNDYIAKKAVVDEIDRAFIEELESIKYLYKNEDFDYENEARFVETISSININDIKFDRNSFGSKDKIRHYYEHDDLATNKILITGCRITLGPCVEDQYNLLFCLKELQRRAGLPGPEIRLSKVSYRNT